MPSEIATIIAAETASGIPRLWEWGGLIIYSTLINFALGAALCFVVIKYMSLGEATLNTLNSLNKTIERQIENTKILIDIVKGGNRD